MGSETIITKGCPYTISGAACVVTNSSTSNSSIFIGEGCSPGDPYGCMNRPMDSSELTVYVRQHHLKINELAAIVKQQQADIEQLIQKVHLLTTRT